MQIGEYCLVQKPREKHVSDRFQRKNFDEVYQVVEVFGGPNEEKVYTVSNLHGQRENLGFTQPVAAERLTPVDILPLSAPSEDARTRLSVTVDGVQREGSIVSQRVDGLVNIRFDDDPDTEEVVDLAKTQYLWL